MDLKAAFAAFLVQDDLFTERLAPKGPLLGVAAAFDPVIFIKCLSDITRCALWISFQALAYEFVVAALFEDLFLDRAFVDFETEEDRLVFDVPEEWMQHAIQRSIWGILYSHHFDCSMDLYPLR